MAADFVDSLPIWGVFVVFAIIALLFYEGGFRIGRWWQGRTPEEKEGPTGMLVGSLLALMAFLLAITMGMAADRFDARRGAVLAEANSIGTTFLRADFLPEPAASQSRELVREYVPLRIVEGDPSDEELAARVAGSEEILTELWSIAEGTANETPGSEMLALYITTLNETIDANTTRVTAGLYARVPETIALLLFFGSVLTLGMVGFSAGLTRRRSPLTAVVLVVVLGAVFALIIDIDRPVGGTLTTGQQPLIDLERQIGPPMP
jgi:hypothetical protein